MHGGNKNIQQIEVITGLWGGRPPHSHDQATHESIEVYRCGVDPKYGSCINDPILKPGFQGVVFDVRGKGLQLDHHLRWPLFLAEKTHHKPFSANSGESYQNYQVYR